MGHSFNLLHLMKFISLIDQKEREKETDSTISCWNSSTRSDNLSQTETVAHMMLTVPANFWK